MPAIPLLLSGLVIQLVAQWFGGAWGAAAGGVAIGVGVGLVLNIRGAFRTGFLAAFVAAALLLAFDAVRGAALLDFAGRLGQNFKLPGWGLLLLSMLLPALQSAGLAGGVARLTTKDPH